MLLAVAFISMETMCDSSIVGRAVQRDATLLRCASVITQQEKCGELLAQTFHQSLKTQRVAAKNVGTC